MTSLLGKNLVELASEDPLAAILRAYEAVRTTIAGALEEAGAQAGSDSDDALALIRRAESAGITPPEVTDAVLGLNVLHNLARHAPSRDPAPAQAYEYLAMADGALYSLAIALKKHIAATSADAASPS